MKRLLPCAAGALVMAGLGWWIGVVIRPASDVAAVAGPVSATPGAAIAQVESPEAEPAAVTAGAGELLPAVTDSGGVWRGDDLSVSARAAAGAESAASPAGMGVTAPPGRLPEVDGTAGKAVCDARALGRVVAAAGLRVPLAFVPANPAALTPAMEERIARLQEEFWDEVGGSVELEDPGWQDRWLQAQRRADERYRCLFGWQAFNEMQWQRERDLMSKRD